MRDYKTVFALIASCVCDTKLTPQEEQIFGIFSDIIDSVTPDVHACRLKLFFVSYGCREFMPFPFDVEEELVGYVSKIKHISCYCRLSVDEEAFLYTRIPEESPVRLLANIINYERIMKSSCQINFLGNLHNQTKKLPNAFSPVYSVHPHPQALSESVDLDLIDSGKPSWQSFLNKFSIGQYQKVTEERKGADAVKFLLGLLDERKYPGFFILYDLLSDGIPLHILPDESPRALGTVLLATVARASISGVENVILKVMDTHPEIARSMPAFEDKRKIKIVNFTGYDIFQTHIINASNFIKQHLSELNAELLALDKTPAYHQPPNLPIEVPNRLKLNPMVTDFKLAARPIKRSDVQAVLPDFMKFYNRQEMDSFAGAPLSIIGLEKYVVHKPVGEIGCEVVSGESPLSTVRNHPSSCSHIAKITIDRMEEDILEYGKKQNNSEVPYLLITAACSVSNKSSIQEAGKSLTEVINRLTSLRDRDSKFSRHSIKQVVAYANGRMDSQKDSVEGMGHVANQTADIEASMVRVTVLIYCIYCIYCIELFKT